ncbi:MAG: hypothetical protein ACE5FE_00770 [Acidiferrobacterales bacterium]
MLVYSSVGAEGPKLSPAPFKIAPPGTTINSIPAGELMKLDAIWPLEIGRYKRRQQLNVSFGSEADIALLRLPVW